MDLYNLFEVNWSEKSLLQRPGLKPACLTIIIILNMIFLTRSQILQTAYNISLCLFLIFLSSKGTTVGFILICGGITEIREF